MKKRRWSEGIHDDLAQAMTENAVAKLRYESMPEEEQRKLRQRAARAEGPEETKELTDDLVGWQKGHPPYQL